MDSQQTVWAPQVDERGIAGHSSWSGGLHEFLCLGGWQAWVLDGEDRVRRVLGVDRDRRLVGASLERVLGESAPAALAALAELEAVGRVAPRPAGLGRREIAAFHHRDGRVIATRVTDDEARRADWSALLSGAAEVLGAASGSAEVIDALVDCLQLHFKAAVAVMRLDAGTGALICAASEGLNPAARSALRTVLDSPSVLWTAIKSRSPQLSVEVSLDPRFDLTAVDRALRGSFGRDPGGACAVLPLLVGDRVLGCLAVRWPAPGLPGAEGLLALRQLVRIASVSLDKARTVDALLSEQRVLAAVTDSVSDGVLGVTEDAELLVYNQRLQELVGWTREDVARDGWLSLVYPDPRVRAELDSSIAALMHGLPEAGRMLRLTCKDGRERALEVRSRRLTLPGGRSLMMGFYRDLSVEQDTQRRQMREENIQRLGRLAGGIAHGFNNILGAIMGHADLMLAEDTVSELCKARLGVITESARRGGQLANQLLVFGKSATLQTSAVDLADQLQRLLRRFAGELPPGIALRVSLRDDLPPADVDAAQIRQALLNLLQNAQLAVGSSGEIEVSLALCPRPQALDFCSSEAPPAGTPMLCVAVKDSGPGLSPRALEHLFEPFFSTRSEGHGLGLAAVQGILDAHCGAIELDNRGGALFQLYLPISGRPKAALPGLIADQPGGSRLIWAVDDEVFLLDFVQVLLVSRGYTVEIFSHPEEALARAAAPKGSRPELLLLDVVMPALQGPELLVKLRDLGVACPACFVSGYPRESIDLADTSATAFLQKPYTSWDLLATVAELVGEPASIEAN